MLGKVLTIQSFPPAILNCNAFLQNEILRKFRHGSYDKHMLIYTIPVIIFTPVVYIGRFAVGFLRRATVYSRTVAVWYSSTRVKKWIKLS